MTLPEASRLTILVVDSQIQEASGNWTCSTLPMTGRPVRRISCSSANVPCACSEENKSMSALPSASCTAGSLRAATAALLIAVYRLDVSLK